MEQDFKDYLRQIIYEAMNEVVENNVKDKNVLLSRSAASSRLNVDLTTLWRWEKSGYLKPIRLGRTVYYKLADIEARERGEISITK